MSAVDWSRYGISAGNTTMDPKQWATTMEDIFSKIHDPTFVMKQPRHYIPVFVLLRFCKSGREKPWTESDKKRKQTIGQYIAAQRKLGPSLPSWRVYGNEEKLSEDDTFYIYNVESRKFERMHWSECFKYDSWYQRFFDNFTQADLAKDKATFKKFETLMKVDRQIMNGLCFSANILFDAMSERKQKHLDHINLKRGDVWDMRKFFYLLTTLRNRDRNTHLIGKVEAMKDALAKRQKFMTDKGLNHPRDLWLLNMEAMLKAQHYDVGTTSEIFDFDREDYRANARERFIVFWEAGEHDEFIITDNSFGSFEGCHLESKHGMSVAMKPHDLQKRLYTRDYMWHQLFVLSPKLVMALCHGTFIHPSLTRAQRGRYGLRPSVLEKLPHPLPPNYYKDLHIDECRFMKQGWELPEDLRDTFGRQGTDTRHVAGVENKGNDEIEFKVSRLSSQNVALVNSILLLNQSIQTKVTSFMYRNPNAICQAITEFENYDWSLYTDEEQNSYKSIKRRIYNQFNKVPSVEVGSSTPSPRSESRKATPSQEKSDEKTNEMQKAKIETSKKSETSSKAPSENSSVENKAKPRVVAPEVPERAKKDVVHEASKSLPEILEPVPILPSDHLTEADIKKITDDTESEDSHSEDEGYTPVKERKLYSDTESDSLSGSDSDEDDSYIPKRPQDSLDVDHKTTTKARSDVEAPERSGRELRREKNRRERASSEKRAHPERLKPSTTKSDDKSRRSRSKVETERDSFDAKSDRGGSDRSDRDKKQDKREKSLALVKLELQREKQRLERQKLELDLERLERKKLEKERERLERQKLDMERLEIERQKMQLAREKDDLMKKERERDAAAMRLQKEKMVIKRGMEAVKRGKAELNEKKRFEKAREKEIKEQEERERERVLSERLERERIQREWEEDREMERRTKAAKEKLRQGRHERPDRSDTSDEWERSGGRKSGNHKSLVGSSPSSEPGAPFRLPPGYESEITPPSSSHSHNDNYMDDPRAGKKDHYGAASPPGHLSPKYPASPPRRHDSGHMSPAYDAAKKLHHSMNSEAQPQLALAPYQAPGAKKDHNRRRSDIPKDYNVRRFESPVPLPPLGASGRMPKGYTSKGGTESPQYSTLALNGDYEQNQEWDEDYDAYDRKDLRVHPSRKSHPSKHELPPAPKNRRLQLEAPPAPQQPQQRKPDIVRLNTKTRPPNAPRHESARCVKKTPQLKPEVNALTVSTLYRSRSPFDSEAIYAAKLRL